MNKEGRGKRLEVKKVRKLIIIKIKITSENYIGRKKRQVIER